MKKIYINIGCFFIAISAFLFASKHITAAIISSHINSPQVNYYEGALDLIGLKMSFWIILSLLVGVTFLLSGIWSNLKRASVGNIQDVEKKEDLSN